MYSEQNLKRAAEFRAEIHAEALARVRAVFPHADHVVDRYPADAYFQEVWDYPGKWYTIVAVPSGTGGRTDLVGIIVRDTLEAFRKAGASPADDVLCRLLAEYPDLACVYRLVTPGGRDAETNGVFPYRGADSHRLALACAARGSRSDGKERSCDGKAVKGRKLSGNALFAPVHSDGWRNYRRAFLYPPHGRSYTDSDFERVNAVLFPGGAAGLEVYRWTARRPEDSGEGCERQDPLCLTVYDRSLDRFVVITASAAD